jgi:hypothetical protein
MDAEKLDGDNPARIPHSFGISPLAKQATRRKIFTSTPFDTFKRSRYIARFRRRGFADCGRSSADMPQVLIMT